MISMHMACSAKYVGVQILEKESTIQGVFECKMQVLMLKMNANKNWISAMKKLHVCKYTL